MSPTESLTICAVCSTPLHAVNLASGYTVHPTCDHQWRSSMRMIRTEAGALEVWPCSQSHEAALYTNRTQLAIDCRDCRTKLYRR